MNIAMEGEMRIDSESDIVTARKTIRDLTAKLGFGLTDITRIVTAASELTRNIYCYAGVGVMRWRSLNQGKDVGLELTFEDHGPGMADVAQCMEPHFSTSGGLGLGLPGAKRLMGKMTVEPAPGKGTTILMRKWLKT